MFIRTKRVKKPNGKVYTYRVRQHSVRVGPKKKKVKALYLGRADQPRENLVLANLGKRSYDTEENAIEAARIEKEQDAERIAGFKAMQDKLSLSVNAAPQEKAEETAPQSAEPAQDAGQENASPSEGEADAES